ncbi:hypothetical protein [uncultured Amaricoccus sp.]|uniref:hypothetical protein n=1 Tax=uncultured Amaricoccus sp. TaxID=339341 RepID=UPI002615BDA4|nr:hypothetical protein [uncultured Amaricoccus sp.]
MTIHPKTIRRRLERAGYVSVIVAGKPGWVPAAYAARIKAQIEMHREDVAALEAEPARPVGRPPKPADG